MKKSALLFVLFVITPSLVLAWLAVLPVRDQQLALEHHRATLYRSVAETLVKDANGLLIAKQREFNHRVESLVTARPAADAAPMFDDYIREWPLAEVGFVVSMEGRLSCPSAPTSPVARQFLVENSQFLCNVECVEVQWQQPKVAAGGVVTETLTFEKVRKVISPRLPPLPSEAPPIDSASVPPAFQPKTVYATKSAPRSSEATDAGTDFDDAEFRQLVGDATEGTIARFLQNKLKLLFWHRPPLQPQSVFGAQINLTRLVDELKEIIRLEDGLQREICVALLDDAGKLIELTHPGFALESKRAFVEAEVGKILPHWKVAVYLLNPAQFTESARTVRRTIGLQIGLLLLAIAAGSWLIAADLRRQHTLSRQKTDFVSNVSHELKTPLTSIRMFSELLADGRVHDASKQRHYLSIITAETARLTRLINNVLDFSRLERGEQKYQFASCDAVALARETIEAYQPHLEANGFELAYDLPPDPLIVHGDRDALAQVLVNLLSNAEKYGGEKKEITVRVARQGAAAVSVQVLDRGPGVPAGSEQRIFEQFFRAHDSLASGICGSGLGLTLARQIARAHGGDVTYAPREGGGSCFTLELPMHQT